MTTSDTSVISQQCALLLEQLANSKANDQLKIFFDAVTTELTKSTQLIANDAAISKIVATLIAVDKKRLCQQSQLIDHQLLIILRDYLIRFLFNQEQRELVNNLSILFDNICYSGVSSDGIFRLIISKSLVDHLCVFFHHLEKHINETTLIEVINRLLRIFQNIQMIRFDQQNNPIFELLFNTIVECLTSPFFQQILPTLPTKMADLNPIQTLLFDTSIEFMYWQSYEDNSLRKKSLLLLTERLLHPTVELISSSSVSEPIARLSSLLALNIVMMDERKVDKDYYSLIDRCISIFDQKENDMIKQTFLATFCFLAYDMDLGIHMKNSSHLKSSLLDMSQSDNFEISFYAYRILAVIMTEEDIKTLPNADKIVGVFCLYFISMLDDPIQRTAFHSLLHSIKSFVQHEQIKKELIEQDVIPLLIRCVTEQSFHTIKTRQCALEILLALSFNHNGLKVIEQDLNFMNYLKTLKNSPEDGIQRAADHLLWQFEQKANNSALVTSHTSKSQFDIMLSYSHNDKHICFQIYEHLVNNGFHVWLDRDKMHGDTMMAMANAIENAEFVVICMSEAYKQSPYCQLEANYAFQRQCKLIPLVMKAKYKPDGWLGILVSGKIYVDFSKYEFHLAYSMLKNEIEQKRHITNATIKPIQTAHELTAPPPPSSSSIVDQHQLKTIDLPHCVDAWSAEHVRYFLISNNFASLLPVCHNFNGRLLHQTYKMCQSGRETMFQSMRSEVSVAENTSPLTLGTYLRFLEELNKYIPANTNGQLQGPMSMVCSIM